MEARCGLWKGRKHQSYPPLLVFRAPSLGVPRILQFMLCSFTCAPRVHLPTSRNPADSTCPCHPAAHLCPEPSTKGRPEGLGGLGSEIWQWVPAATSLRPEFLRLGDDSSPPAGEMQRWACLNLCCGCDHRLAGLGPSAASTSVCCSGPLLPSGGHSWCCRTL